MNAEKDIVNACSAMTAEEDLYSVTQWRDNVGKEKCMPCSMSTKYIFQRYHTYLREAFANMQTEITKNMDTARA